MPRVLLIANPVAARTDESTRNRVVKYLTGAGWDTEVAVTSARGDAGVLARRGVEAGLDAIAVFGGDGTTMQAAASLVGTEIPLALIPGGTGNLLAGNLRIPSDPLLAARVLVGGGRRRIDLGCVILPDGAHYFGVACGAGIDAEVMGRTATRDKRRWGIGAYFATTFRALREIRSTSCVVTVDGERIEASAALVLIMNCGEIIPPFVRVRREISPEDGVLDLLTIAADTPWEAIRSLVRVLLNNVGDIRETSYLRYARGRQFRVESATPLEVQFDGDPVGHTPFMAEVVPGALTVMCPVP